MFKCVNDGNYDGLIKEINNEKNINRVNYENNDDTILTKILLLNKFPEKNLFLTKLLVSLGINIKKQELLD